MQKLCYKNYRFNYNPAVLRISSARSVCRISAPFAGEAVVDMGARAREVSGEGEFFGENALASYQNLYAVFAEGGCGVLCVPGKSPFTHILPPLK